MEPTRRTELERRLPTHHLGRPLYWVDEIDSTNRLMRKWADEGAAEGTVLVADYQSAGRGRRGRLWLAPPGTGLLMSVLLRPTRSVALIPFVTAIALATAIEQVTELPVHLKWPNDVRVRGRKVAGILAEAQSTGERHTVVVGVGINVSVPDDVLAEVPVPATSLSREANREIDRVELLLTFLPALEQAYERLEADVWDLKAWKQRSDTFGREVTVVDAKRRWHGTAVDLGDDGALLVRDDDGTTHRVYAGDVTVRYEG